VNCLLDKPFTIAQLREAMNWVLGRHEETPGGESGTRWVHDDQHLKSNDSPDSPTSSDDF
jgi:hypothetical protein